MRNVNLFLFKSGWLNFLIFILVFFSILPSYCQVSNYWYKQGTTGATYTPIAGGTNFQSGTALNTDAVSSAITIPSFTFNGVAYTQFYISNNGFIAFATAPSTTNYTPMSNGTTGYAAVSGFGGNLVASTVAGALPSIDYGSVGSDFVIQFTDMARSAVASADRINFQLILKNSGAIDIMYGNCVTTSTSTTIQPQVGIRGLSNADNVVNRLSGSFPDGSPSWTDVGWANSGSTATNVRYTTTASCYPSSGLTFSYQPPSTPVYTSIPYSQDFEAAWSSTNQLRSTPSNNWKSSPTVYNNSWRREDDGLYVWAGVSGSYTPAGATSSLHSARFHSFNASSGLQGSLDLYLDCSSGSNFQLTFDRINPTGTDVLAVFLSIDGGVTFSQIGSNYGTAAVWTNIIVPFTSSSATTVLRFRATSDFGDDDIGIDNISVTLPPSCIQPTALSNTAITSTTASHSWSAPSPAPSVGYEWAVTTSITPPLSGLATTSLTSSSTGLIANTTYYLHVRSECTAGVEYSTWATSTSFFTGYCQASSTSQASWISAFSTTGGSSNITHTAGTGAAGGYADLSATNIVSNYIGNPTNFSITSGGPTVGNAIWVDWNNNLTFETGERVYVSTGYGTTVSGSFAVPAATPNGNYRMRVITDYNNSAPSNPCGNIARGEYKDFTFAVIDAPSCLPPTALTINTVTTNSSGFSWTASVSTPSDGYEWEVRSSGAPGSGATGLADNGSTGAGVTMDMATGLTEATTYSLYVRSNCGSGSFSDWTAATTFYTGYCIPAPSSVDGLGITNVTFGVSPNIVNNTSVAEPTNYGNYAVQIGDLQQNVSSSVSITYQTGYTYDTKIWIDFNDDLDFNDAGENVYTGVSTSANPTTLVATFTIPLSVSLGNHRLRIGGVDVGPPTACYTGTYGTYEDYTVNVVAAPPNCIAPTNQPTSFVASNIGTETFIANFTAAASVPDNYIIVRYLTGETPTNPVDFTSYTVGQTIGVSGNVRSINSSTILNETGLTASTTYDYYIYSYNNVGCVGPVYNLISPLFGKVTTCASTTGTPGTPVASLVGTTSFTATWSASATPGVDYIIDVATNSLFTSFVSGYNGLNVGMTLSTPVMGLSANTTYYVRVRADIGGCFSTNSANLTVVTLCDPVTLFFENFESTTGALFPDCWKKVGSLGSAYSQASSGISGARNLYMYDGATVSLPPVNNADAGTHRLRMKVRANFTAGETVFAGYLTNPNDASTFVSLGSIVTNSNTIPQDFIIPVTAPTGVTTLALKTGTAALSFLVDDVYYEAIPTAAVDWGNLQFPGSGTIYTTNAFDAYGQTYEPGVTEGAGQGTGVLAWLGYNNADTDPNTWTNWIPATFNVQVGNNDEFIGTIPANTLSPGTYYYAYRYQLSGGPFVYGGYRSSGGGIWDGSNNLSGVLTVNACPSVSASATMMTICQNTSTTISATSANPNYTYQWNPGSLVGASHLVSPSSSTSYVVTATDLGIACTSTASVSVNVVSGPSGVTANASPATICVGASTNLLGAANPNTVLLSESFESGLPSGWTVVNGGTGNNWTFPLSLSGSARTGTRAAQYSYNLTNPANTWLFTTGQNLTAGVTYTISSWYRTSASFPEKLKVTVGSAATIVSQTTVIQDLGTIQTATYTEQTATFTPVTTGVYYFAWNAYSDADEFFINLDDISITTPAILSYSWTSTPSGFTSMSQNPTGIAPLVNTLYNLSVTDSNTGCANTASVNVQFATSAIVSSSADSGAGTLRAAIECLGEGGTITYDQPTTTATVLTTPLNITKSVTIQGLSSASRPEITVPAAGVSIDATKTLTLQNVDVKSSGTATFSGAGDVSITGTTVGKQ